MKAVADASALLSLEHMAVLDDAIGIMDIYTASPVEDELKEIAGFRDEKSVMAKRILDLIQNGKIKCFEIKGDKSTKHASMNHILYLCTSAKIQGIITDDAETAFHLSRMAAQKGVKLRMCAAVLVELIRTGKISTPAARGKLEELMKKRSWEGGVLEVLVKKYMDENAMLEF